MIRQYLTLLEMQRRRPVTFSEAFGSDRELESCVAAHSSQFVKDYVSFACSIVEPQFVPVIAQGVRYHIVPIREVDIRVRQMAECDHVYLSCGTLELFEFIARSSLHGESFTDYATSSRAMKRSVLGTAMLKPSLIPGKTKQRFLEEAFGDSHPSARHYIRWKKNELKGQTDLQLIHCNMLRDCLANSLVADYLNTPFDLATLNSKFSLSIRKTAGIQTAYLVAFALLHEHAHRINASTENEVADAAGFDRRLWSEINADAFALRMTRPAHRSLMAEAANEYFGILQASPEDYPDPLARTVFLKNFLRRLSGNDDHVGPSIPITNYREQFGVSDTLFGVETPIDKKVNTTAPFVNGRIH